MSITLKNSGALEGKEVVQLYLKDEFSSVTRPIKELKGFELVTLKAGKSKIIEFELTDRELGFYNNEGKFIVEPGTFKVFVGGDSTADLSVNFEI